MLSIFPKRFTVGVIKGFLDRACFRMLCPGFWACLPFVSGLVSHLVCQLFWDAASASPASFSCLRSLVSVLVFQLSPSWRGMLCPPRRACLFLVPNSCVSPSLPSCLPRCLPPGLESGWMVRPSRSCLPAFSPACFPAGLGCCVSCLLVCPPSCLPDGLGYRDRLAGLVFHQLFAVLGGVVLRFLKFDMNCTIVATCD